MIVVLLNSYIAILALFVWLRFIPFNTFWKTSPVIVALALLVGLFIPMGWGAPSGPAAVVRNSVQIIPSVAGEVVDVPVVANTPIKEGDVLFRIDPTTYEAQVQTIEAQLKLQETRLAQMTQLESRGTGRAFDVEQRQAEVDQLKAQLEGAKWNLDKTTVRAPADGYVTNLARCLRMADLLSDKRAAENLRAVAADSFSRAVEMEATAQPKINAGSKSEQDETATEVAST